MLLCYGPYESVTTRINFWKEKHDEIMILPYIYNSPTNEHRKVIRTVR